MNKSTKIQSKSIGYIVAASFAAISWVAAAGSAHAADPEAALTKTVVYADLNLDSAAGAQELYSRLRSAAKTVCSPFEGADLTRKAEWRTCFDHAMASAVAQVNHTAVTALYVNRQVRAPKG